MTDKIFSSNKKHLLFLGFELTAIGLSLLILINFKIVSVQEITHYNIISLLLIVFGIFTLISGYKKRSFVLSTDEISFINKTTKFHIYFKDIYLVRIFHADNSRQVTLGIVSDIDKSVFQVSTAFFEAKVLLEVARELYALSEKFEFFIEDDAGWLNLPDIPLPEEELNSTH